MKANTGKKQIQCIYCEEMVHPYATHCPYCSKEIISTLEETESQFEQSLTQTNSLTFKEEADKSSLSPLVTPQVFYVLLSLILLLAGSCFFFFGILIKLFSTNGVFTLEWNIDRWPYFVGSAVVSITLGLIMFSKIEK